MNNLVSTEKSLKRWLKSRVKITMATVVGFLIAGTVAFGADAPITSWENKNAENTTNMEDVDGDYQEKTTILNFVGNADGTYTLTNSGNLTVKTKNNGIYANAKNGANVVVENSGNINVNTGHWSSGICGVVEDNNSSLSYTNKGKITVVDGAGMDITFRKTDNADGSTTIAQGNGSMINEGTINVTTTTSAKNSAVGMMLENSNKNAKAENKGTINVNGEGIGVELKGDATFTNSGTIIVDGGNKSFAIRGDEKNQTINLEKGTKIEGDIDLSDAVDEEGNDVVDNDIINITEVDNVFGKVLGAEIINVKKSNVTFSDGEMTKILDSENKTLLNIENSNVTNKMDLKSIVSEQNEIIEASNLINNYGREKGTYTLINEGTLEANNAASGIYTNANAENVIMNVTNKGNVKIETNSWGTGLNGKFDSTIKNAEIKLSNAGNIFVENGAGMDITNEGDASNKGTAVNEKAGTITTSGFSVGMLVDGAGMSAVNEGTIVINDAAKESSGDGRSSYGMQSKNGASVTNNGIIIMKYDSDGVLAMGTSDKAETTKATGVNNGKIKLSNVASLDDIDITLTDNKTLEEAIVESLFEGNIEHKGMIVNSLGVNLFADANVGNTNDLSGSDINVGDIGNKEGTLDKITVNKVGATITGATENNEIKTEVFNVSGTVNITGGEGTSVVVKDAVTNLDVNGTFAVRQNAELKIAGGNVNGSEENAAVSLAESAKLTLGETIFNGNITGNGAVNVADTVINGNIEAKSFDVVGTEEKVNTTYVNGEIKVETITVGKDSEDVTFVAEKDDDIELDKTVSNILELSSDSKFVKKDSAKDDPTLTIEKDGKVVLDIGSDYTEIAFNDETQKVYSQNAFGNTTDAEVTVKGDNDKTTDDLVLKTGNITGEKVVVNFRDATIGTDSNTVTTVTDSEIYTIDGNEKEELNGADSVVLTYNTNLYKDNSILNNINNAAVVASNVFSTDKEVRASQLDKIYAGNIYSETVRAAYDGIKLSEDAVLSMGHDIKAGEFKADGKALFSKDKYTKDGTIGSSYDTDVETTGLLASFEYGLSDNTTVGAVFSGAKQDIDTADGNADADLFYLGAFANRTAGNYDLTAGLGYQLGKYDADNNIANVSASDKYDSNAFSAYVQGKYNVKLDDTLKFVPKAKLGYTYVDQDNAKDSYFGVSDAEISTFDVEVGFDVTKSVQLAKSNLDLTFGTSYVKTMGDTDEDFTGRFYGEKVGEQFNVLGAEIAENVVRFSLEAEMTYENGFFYNGGFAYEFGSGDTKSYGANVGVGYKF